MQKTRQDEFLEFNGKHSDILQIFFHKNQKKILAAVFGETYFGFKPGMLLDVPWMHLVYCTPLRHSA